MPCGGHEGCLAFGTCRAEEVDWLMVGVGKSDWNHLMSGADVEFRYDEPGDVELLDGHFATLFYFSLIFTVFVVLKFHGGAGASSLKLYFGADDPFRRELIVNAEGKTRYGDSVAVFLRGAFGLETVDAVVFESCHHLAVAAEAEFVVARRVSEFLCGHGRGSQSRESDHRRSGLVFDVLAYTFHGLKLR